MRGKNSRRGLRAEVGNDKSTREVNFNSSVRSKVFLYRGLARCYVDSLPRRIRALYQYDMRLNYTSYHALRQSHLITNICDSGDENAHGIRVQGARSKQASMEHGVAWQLVTTRVSLKFASSNSFNCFQRLGLQLGSVIEACLSSSSFNRDFRHDYRMH